MDLKGNTRTPHSLQYRRNSWSLSWGLLHHCGLLLLLLLKGELNNTVLVSVASVATFEVLAARSSHAAAAPYLAHNFGHVLLKDSLRDL